MILTSWDDGHPLDLRIGEMLIKHGLAGTFFVPIQNREGDAVMTGAEMRELDSAHEVASHTRTHRYLLSCSSSDALAEIETGKQQLEDFLGHSVEGFCYPGGKFDQKISRMVRNAGFSYARTVENLRIDFGQNLWEIPTTLQFYPHGPSTLLKNSARHWAFSKPTLIVPRFRHRDFFAYARYLAQYCVKSKAIFHLWGHSWEIEEFGLWAELDNFFDFLGDLPCPSQTLRSAIKSHRNWTDS